MTLRKFPSLGALRAFEASARHQSFTLAAQELSVTPGAISHQVKALEEELQIRLFERLRNQLRLTAAGQRYLLVLGAAFDQIERGTQNLYRAQTGRALVISTSPNFAAKWLVPRLGEFSALHPTLEIRIDLATQVENFLDDEVSLAIRHGKGPWPDVHCTRLRDEYLLPVCSPQQGRVAMPADLANLPLLHAYDHSAWSAWFAAHGLERGLAQRGLVLNQESAVVDAAVSGQGVALARATLCVSDLRQQRLCVALPSITPIELPYWLVYPQREQERAEVTVFCEWLLQAFEEDRHFLDSLAAAGTTMSPA